MTIPEISKQVEVFSADIVEAAIQRELNARIKIMQKVNSVFADLEKVMDGRGSLTSVLERFAAELSKNSLPALFSEIWDGTEYPEEWIRVIGRKT